MAGDRERAALAGFDGYIEKPISVRALPGQIEAFFAGASEATGLTSGGQE
jgi:two-component system cell cycle response regulator DivK